MNAGESFAPHGINQFADMTQEEFAAKYLMPKGQMDLVHARMAQAPLLELPEVGALPTTFQWNDSFVTPVKNQEQCGR